MSNAWRTDFETGLVDDFDFTIVRAFFAPDQRYNNGNTTLLQWHGSTDNEDLPETHVYFPLGKGWASTDGGKTIVHESGKADKYFVKSSLIAKLIERCVEDFGMGDLLAARGGPFESVVWQGLTFHMKYETVDFGSGIDSKPKLFPVRFVGEAAVETTKASARAKLVAKSQPAEPEVSLRDQVIAAMAPYKAEDDFAGAQQAAIEIPGVAESDLIDEILDESGIWQQIAA